MAYDAPGLTEDLPAEPATGRTAIAPPRQSEDDLWTWIETLADEAERVKREESNFEKIGEFLDIFRGKHWKSNVPSYRAPVVANELRSLILSDVNDLTESVPRIYVTRDKSKGGRDKQAERALRAVWVREQVDLELVYACLWARLCGVGFIGCDWDPNAAHGLGDVAVSHRDPRTIFPDPDATDDKKWLYVVKAQGLDLLEIRRLWPLTGMRVEPDDHWSEKTEAVYGSTPQTPFYMGPLYSGSTSARATNYGYKKARARVIDVLVLDDTTEVSVEEEKGPDGQLILDAQGQPKLKVETTAKYPRGRRIVGANRRILYDGPNAAPDFGVLRVILEPAPGSFWTPGWVEGTGELQMAADKGLSQIVENATRLNNGTVVATTNTGLDFESFASIPGQIVQINPGSEFKVVYPPPMPADMIQFPFRMLELQRQVHGFPASRTGQGGRGNVSPELTETEIAQAQAMTRLASRMLYATVQRLAEMMFARMAAGYTTKRILPAVEGESFEPVVWEPMDDPDQYFVHVGLESFQVMSRTMLKRLSLALAKLRLIDRQSALEQLGWPDAGTVAERLNKQEAMANFYKEAGRAERRKRGG